jgi:hypothetical protein
LSDEDPANDVLMGMMPPPGHLVYHSLVRRCITASFIGASFICASSNCCVVMLLRCCIAALLRCCVAHCCVAYRCFTHCLIIDLLHQMHLGHSVVISLNFEAASERCSQRLLRHCIIEFVILVDI